MFMEAGNHECAHLQFQIVPQAKKQKYIISFMVTTNEKLLTQCPEGIYLSDLQAGIE